MQSNLAYSCWEHLPLSAEMRITESETTWMQKITCTSQMMQRPAELRQPGVGLSAKGQGMAMD